MDIEKKSMISETADISEREINDMAAEIFVAIRGKLIQMFPLLEAAAAGLRPVSDPEIRFFGTDGECFRYHSRRMIVLYAQDPGILVRGLLHVLLHCLQGHLFLPVTDQDICLDSACDVVVEQIIDRTGFFEKKCGNMPGMPVAASVREIMGYLSVCSEKTREMLQMQCRFDDHECWRSVNNDHQKRQRDKWKMLADHSGEGVFGKRGEGSGSSGGGDACRIDDVKKSRNEYQSFLSKFAVWREEMIPDQESFDYIAYTYGMDLYGDMPMIEELEYKEVKRLEELVIAIDTSGSCRQEMVKQFLEETYAILDGGGNFFSRFEVHLLQCDCCLEEVVILRSTEDWYQYAEQITITGRGGTDFRPVFRYIEQKKKIREIRDLKALIYFSDGDGIYPEQKPEYETVFVFVKTPGGHERIPTWVKQIIIDQDGYHEYTGSKV